MLPASRLKGLGSVFWTEQRKKTCSIGLTLLAAALALWARTAWSAAAALAMAVSAVGDGLLAGYPACFQKVKDRLIKGGLVFFAAHCLYMLALVLYARRSVQALLPPFLLPALVFLLLSCLHGYWFCLRGASNVPLSFFAASMAYLLTVGAHAALAVCVSAQSGGPIWISAVGAALFYLSDAILLAYKYGRVPGKDCSSPVWFTYAPAQLLLLMGFFLAR